LRHSVRTNLLSEFHRYCISMAQLLFLLVCIVFKECRFRFPVLHQTQAAEFHMAIAVLKEQKPFVKTIIVHLPV